MTNSTVIAQYFYICDNDQWNDPNVPFKLLNRLYIAFTWIRPNSDGNWVMVYNDPKDQEKITTLIKNTRRTNPGAKIFISSGYDEDGEMYKSAAKNADAFAESVISFIRANDMDGYDMDWENGIDGQAMLTLLTAVKSKLVQAGKQDNKTYRLTLAVWPSPNGRGYGSYLPNIAKAVDQINIMSYGPACDLHRCVDSYNNNGVRKNQIIGGVDTLGPAGTIVSKCLVAQQNGLAGMMAWRLDNDYVEEGKPTYKGAVTMYKTMHKAMRWTKVANVAQYKWASRGSKWDNEIVRKSKMTLESAQEYAESDQRINFFFLMRGPMFLEAGEGCEAKGQFNSGDAVFFCGQYCWGSAPQADGYIWTPDK
jgi:hypothetical protein